MPKEINGKQRPEKSFKGKIISIGHGKSAYFFAASTPASVPFTILTDHPNDQNKVKSMWDDEELHKISQTNDVNAVIKQLEENPAGEPITLICSTDPQRFRHWLDQIMPKIPEDKKQDIIFVLPQSPNTEFEYLKSRGYTTTIFDYYPGIGGVNHDDGSKGVSKATAGVKEETFYCSVNTANFAGRETILEDNLRELTLNQEIYSEENHEKFFYNPTNAILHMVGNITHIAQALVDKGVLDASILELKRADEFFKKFEAATNKLTKKGIIDLVGTSLFERGFYREMPSVGPDILMPEISNEIRKIIAAKKWPVSDYDSVFGVKEHLLSKYSQQWAAFNQKDPRHNTPLSEIIHKNPPYQNRQIVVPTLTDKTLKTVESRFYTEEIPTLLAVIKGFEKQCPIIGELIKFGEKMIGREIRAEKPSSITKLTPDRNLNLGTVKSSVSMSSL